MKIEKGNIYSIEGSEYIVFYISTDIIGFIHRDKVQFMKQDSSYFFKQVSLGKYPQVIIEEQTALPNIPSEELQRIREVSLIMDALIKDVYPEWNSLTNTAPNNKVKRAALQAGYCVKSFRRLFYHYLRNGCDMFALIDYRHLKQANSQKKQACIANVHPNTTVLTQKEEALRYGLNIFKSVKNVGKAYDSMIIKFYSTIKTVVKNNALESSVEANPDAPSYYALYRYIAKSLGGKTITEYIKGEKETRNNERYLTGNQRSGIITIGQAGQIDESEFSVSITDEYGRVIGKAVIYCLFDPAAQIITGAYIGLYNNYIGGVVNTLLGMMEPHDEQTKIVGVHCDDYSFPSLYLPKLLYDDRGSEYMSTMMKDAMEELGIKLCPVPVAAGSYKGGVENVFHRLESRVKRELINDGFILRTSDGSTLAKENAVLTLDDLRAIVYRNIIEINTTSLGKLFSPDIDMIKNNIPCVPSEIWKWKLKTCFNPISITDNNRRQKIFCLLWRDKIFIRDRDGISYKGHNLRYFSDEEWFHEMLKSKSDDDIDIRYNDTDVTHIYVRYKGIIHLPVPLSPARDELRSYAGMSWPVYDEIWKENQKERRKQKNKDRNTHLTTVYQNEETLAIAKAAHEGIVTDVNSIPEARAEARVRIENDPNEIRNRILEVNPMTMRLPSTNTDQDEPPSQKKYTAMTEDELAALVEDEE